jgi:hypothetical protein
LATSSNSPRILNYSKILGKTNLTELWSDRLIATLIANPSKLHFGKKNSLHGDLQRLDYDLGNIHTLNIKIKGDIEFQKGINVKLNHGKFSRL